MQLATKETETIASSTTHRRVFLLSHPRTASNLVTRLLSQQEGWLQSEYHFRPAFHYARRALHESKFAQLTSEQRQKYEELFLQGLSKLRSETEAATSQAKHILVKFHVFHLWDATRLYDDAAASIAMVNPTRLHDDFLASWQPVFLIGHPALVFESWYRAEIRVEPIDIKGRAYECFLTFRYSRRLHDWFKSRSPVVETQGKGTELLGLDFMHPIVLDASEVIETESTTSKLCDLLGMDPRMVCYAWEPSQPRDDANFSRRHMSYMSSFWASRCIDKSKSSVGLDLNDKHARWKDEFVAGVADALLTYVKNAMPDYNYLRDKRI